MGKKNGLAKRIVIPAEDSLRGDKKSLASLELRPRKAVWSVCRAARLRAPLHLDA